MFQSGGGGDFDGDRFEAGDRNGASNDKEAVFTNNS
jgi:hypothetical protein